MTIYSRNWQLTGQNKTSGTALAVSTLSGTAYPQVDDLLMVAWASDNASSTTPTLSSMTVTGAGAIGAVTQASSTNASATAAGDVQIGYAWARVTTAFTAASVVNLTLSTAVAAKAAVATTWYSTPTAIDGWDVTTSQAPSSATTATGAGSLDAGNQAVFAGGAVQNTTGPTYTGQQMVYVSNTTGGSAATNVRVLLAQTTAAAQVNISAAEAVFAVRVAIAAPAGPVDLFKTPADTAAGADDATFEFPPKDLTATPADTAAGSDSAVDAQAHVRTPSDTAAGADSHTPIQTFLRTPGDAAAGSDSAVTGPDSRVRVEADGATGSDEATFDFTGGAQDVFATPADVAGGTDALTLDRATSPADTAAGSDAVTLLSLDDRQAADTAAGSDQAITAKAMPRTPADTAAGADLGSMIADRSRPVGDTAAGSDTVNVSQAGAANVSADETAVGSDTVTVLAIRDRTADDTAAGMDNATFQRVGFIDATPIDTAAGSDAVTVVADRPRTANDPAAGSDTASILVTRVTGPADTAAGADSLVAAWDRVRTPADSGIGTEMLLGDRTVLIADSAGGTDAVSLSGSNRVRTIADAADGTDSVTTQKAGAGATSAADVAVGGDQVTTVLVRGTSAADTAAGSDAVTRAWDQGEASADVATAQDVAAFVWAATRPCADAAAGSDQVVAVYDRIRGLSDSAAGQDDVLSDLRPPVDYVVLIEDIAVGTDQATALIHVGELMDNYCWPVDYSCCPGFDAYDNATKLRSIALAGATLRMLTAFRVGGCPITVRPCRTICQDGYNPFGTSAFSPQNWSGTWFNCTCGGDTCGCGALCQLELPRPVGTVDTVKVDGVVLDPNTYRVDDGKWLVRTDGDCWPGCQDLSKPDTEAGTFSVTYLNAIPVDHLGQYAAGVLACEYAKACAGIKCRLPSGVTSITRQGISMELVTGLFPGGKTGIQEVDVWVQMYNPNALTTLPTVWSPNQGGKARTTTSLPAF